MSSFNLNLTTSDTTAFNIDFSNLHDVDYVTACFDSLHNSTRGNPSRTSRLQTLSTFDSTFDTTNATANSTLNHRNSYHSTNTISTTTILSHSNNNLPVTAISKVFHHFKVCCSGFICFFRF